MLRFLDYLFAAFSLLLIFITHKYSDFRRRVRLHHDIPGFRLLICPTGILGNLCPKTIPGVCLAMNWEFSSNYRFFKKFGQDALTSISVFPPNCGIFVCDAAAIKKVVASREKFPKSVEEYEVLAFFGKNILVSEFDDWKRFRKISSPSFSEKNNVLVWETTVTILTQLFDEHWEEQKEVVYKDVVKLTKSLALAVITAAGFGRSMSLEDEIVPAGHKMPFQASLYNFSEDLWMKLIYPDALIRWAPTKALKRVRDSFNNIELYMTEMIAERQSPDYKNDHSDILSNLIDASEMEDEEVKLSVAELISNMILFFIAGYETTGHSLAFVLANLALYQDEQEVLFNHIQSVLPDGSLPTYKDMHKLTQCTAVFYESLRMFPPVPIIPKISAEDNTLVVNNEAGDKIVIPVPKGTSVYLHVTGLHYNPRYWDDPHTFKPSRFTKDYPKDAFIPFSAGARACIGRGFVETTVVAFLSVLVARYKIEVLEEPQFAGETFEERKTRVLATKRGLSLTPTGIPLVFKKR